MLDNSACATTSGVSSVVSSTPPRESSYAMLKSHWKPPLNTHSCAVVGGASTTVPIKSSGIIDHNGVGVVATEVVTGGEVAFHVPSPKTSPIVSISGVGPKGGETALTPPIGVMPGRAVVLSSGSLL